ncbi:Na+/H+ antiporter subunit E [Ilumatobacter nonamiensis]|uniref:Na+/H+ antiporter subunit E n=1 Tax=Ilumatobacter nonamiensis TaxID=467093 RepID=UPI00058E3451|nr:Na+/H+ antiporter subunit E [Ilumatobacter nonamiensis]
MKRLLRTPANVLRAPAIMLWLTVLWVMLWGEVSWANVLGGLAVGAGVVLFARLEPPTQQTTYFRPIAAFVYVVTLIWQLVLSNIRLAVEILTPGDGTHTAIVAVPIRGGSDAVVNLVANSITLTPGTMTVDVWRHDRSDIDIDGDGIIDETTAGATLYVHCIYGEDVEAVRLQVLQLEALALKAFGSDTDRDLAQADLVAHETLVQSTRRAAHDRPRPDAANDTGIDTP